MGQRLLAHDLDLAPDVPVAPEVVAVKVAQPADGLVDGAALEPAHGLQVDEEVQDAAGAEVRGVGTREVAVDLARPVEVDLLRAPGDACELDIALEPGIPWLRCGGGGLRRDPVG